MPARRLNQLSTVASFVGLETDSDPPKPWIYVFVVSKNKRFRFEGDMTAAGLSSFLQSYDQDELAPYLMSEKPKVRGGCCGPAAGLV